MCVLEGEREKGRERMQEKGGTLRWKMSGGGENGGEGGNEGADGVQGGVSRA